MKVNYIYRLISIQYFKTLKYGHNHYQDDHKEKYIALLEKENIRLNELLQK